MGTNVLLADGRKLFREGLSVLLEKHADIHVIGEAEDGQSAAKLMRAMSPHVVILNATLSTRATADLVRSLRGAQKEVRVIVLSMHPTLPFVREILEAGAAACLTKECASEELVSAIRTVVQGRVYLSSKIGELVVSGYVGTAARANAPRPLSEREREILRRIAEGQTTKQIAQALRVGTKTVETHRRRMMEKLNKHSVAELTKYAVMEGLTSLEPTT